MNCLEYVDILLNFNVLLIWFIVLVVVSSIFIDLLILSVFIYFLNFIFNNKWNCVERLDLEIYNLLEIFFRVSFFLMWLYI